MNKDKKTLELCIQFFLQDIERKPYIIYTEYMQIYPRHNILTHASFPGAILLSMKRNNRQVLPAQR